MKSSHETCSRIFCIMDLADCVNIKEDGGAMIGRSSGIRERDEHW